MLQTVESICNKALSGIIVSHTDYDHVGGVVQVLQSYPQTCPVLLTRNFLRDRKKKSVKNLFRYLDETKCVQRVDDATVKQRFHQLFTCHFHRESSGLLYEAIHASQTTKEEGGKYDLPETNESSILLSVVSGQNLHACLTGDAPGYRIIEHFKDKRMHVFHVPHHGSKLNSVLLRNDRAKIKKHAEFLAYYSVTGKHASDLMPLKRKAISLLQKSGSTQRKCRRVKTTLRKLRKYEISAETLKHWSPSEQEVNDAKKLKLSRVPEIPQKVKDLAKQHNLHNDIEDVTRTWERRLETFRCKEFYDHIQASIYVITCGPNPYNHPSIEVINGIAEAAVEGNRQCQVILTSKPEVEAQFSDVFCDSNLVSVWYLDSSSLPYIEIGATVKNTQALKQFTFSSKRNSIVSSATSEFISGDIIMMEHMSNDDPPKLIGDPPLSEYLAIIGYGQRSITLSALLSYIAGPAVTNQLNDLLFPEQYKDWNQVFSCAVKSSSNLNLSATGVYAVSGDIEVEIPTSMELTIQGKAVHKLALHVDNVRTKNLLLEFKISLDGEEEPINYNMSTKLDLTGSCGLPLAEYLVAIGVQCDHCISMAKDLKVGEVIGLILNSIRATALMPSFPDFFFTDFIHYKIDAMQSSISFQQRSISEADLVSVIAPDSYLSIKEDFKLRVQTAFLRFYPSFDESERLIELGGEFEVNGYHLKMSAVPNLDDAPQMKFTFVEKVSVKELLKLLHIEFESIPQEIKIPFSEQMFGIEKKISSGFMIHQQHLQRCHVSSVFFEMDWSTLSMPFLPKSISITNRGKLHLSFWSPIEISKPMIGISADFTCELEQSSTSSKIILDCSVTTTPLKEKDIYRSSMTLRPFLKPYQVTNQLQGAAVIEIISATNESIGECVQSVLNYLWPELTEMIEMRALTLQLLSSGAIETLKLDVTLQKLQLLANKLELRDARLILDYKAEPVSVDFNCQAEIAFFNEYFAQVSFQLPSNETSGFFTFENEDNDFTLDKFVGGLFTLEDTCSQPLLSECLSISIDSVSIAFNIEDSKTIITQASVILSKEELNLQLIRLSSIEVSVSLNRNDGSYGVGFSFQGFISDALYAQLQYQDMNQQTGVLEGSVILASFKEISGASALKEFGVETDALAAFNPLLEGADGFTSELDISIEISKQPEVKFELSKLALNLSNMLILKNFVVNDLQFLYSKSTNCKIYGSLSKTNSDEFVSLELCYSGETVTATITSGDELSPRYTGLLKLSSLLDLIECHQRPDIPQLQPSTDFFELGLKAGSISFEAKPSISVSAFSVDVESQGELCVISEPRIVLTGVELSVEWQKDKEVTGTVKAMLHFSNSLVELKCRKCKEDNIICAAQLQRELIHTRNVMLQFTGQDQELPTLVPEKLLDSKLSPLALAVSITRKQFLLLMNTAYGHGALFIGMFEPTVKKIGAAISISLDKGFQFRQLSEDLAFIDSYMTIANAKLTISVLDGVTVNSFHDNISDLMDALEQSSTLQSPLEGLRDSNQQQLMKGISVHAEMDINQASDTLLANLVKIQKCNSNFSSIALKASIKKSSESSSSEYEVNVEANINQMSLFDYLTFSNIKFLYHLSQSRRRLELSGSMCVQIAALNSFTFGGKIAISDSDARFETEFKSDEPLISPLGMDIVLKSLSMKSDFDFKQSPPQIEVMGSIDIGHAFDFTASVVLKGIVPNLVVFDITSELSIASLLGCVNKNKPRTLMDLKIMKGHFHYAKESTTVKQWMVSKDIQTYAPVVVETGEGNVQYQEGIHAKCDVQLFLEIFTFDIRLYISTDFSTFQISGRSCQKIDLGYIKITDKEFQEGPCVSFQKTDVYPGEFTLEVGLEILDSPWFSGTLSYITGQEWLTGTIECEKSILWMEKPELDVKLIPDPPFIIITDFRFGKDQDRTGIGIFSLIKMLERFCRWLLKMVNKLIHQEFDLHLKTGDNPDSERYSCVFILWGTYKVVFFNSDSATVEINLPELTVKVPKGFTLTDLPQLIIDTLYDAGKQIVQKIVDYIKSRGLLGILSDLAHSAVVAVKKCAKVVYEGVKTVVTKVYEGVKSVGRAIGHFFGWLFGSIKITDSATGEVIAEILGGREGRPLFNREKVVPLFGPLIGITGIHHHRKVIHTAGRAAIQLPPHLNYESHNMKERRTLVDSLRDHHHQELHSHLTLLHAKMLEVEYIKVTPCDTQSNRIKVEWAMDPDITEVDKGDFDYHIKIVAFTNITSAPQTHTVFDDSVNNSNDINPFNVFVEDDIFQQAPIFTVSVKASITMIVKAHGVTNDVTIEGKWKSVDIPSNTQALSPPSSVSMSYNETQQCIGGKLSTVTDACTYLVQLIDDTNFNTIVDQTILHPPTDSTKAEYSFNVSQLSKCAVDGVLVYSIRALAVNHENHVSTFTHSDEKCQRTLSPVNVEFLSLHNNEGTINVKWETNQECADLQYFTLDIVATIGEDNVQQTIITKQILADCNSTMYNFECNAYELVKLLKECYREGMVLKFNCYIFAHAKECLPSIPATSNEIHVLLPPDTLSCYYSKDRKKLHIGWTSVLDAFSYNVKLINTTTEESVYSKIYHDQESTKREHDCELVIDHDILNLCKIAENNVRYRVEVDTVGHGYYLGSIKPTVADTMLHMSVEQEELTFKMIHVDGSVRRNPVKCLKMHYLSGLTIKNIHIQWEPPQFGATSYMVSINHFTMQTDANEVFVSPMSVSFEKEGEYVVSVIPEDAISESTIKFSVLDIFTELDVTQESATSLKIHYGMISNIPIGMHCYLIVESPPDGVIMTALLDTRKSKDIVLSNICPDRLFNMYLFAFSPGCREWAIPKHFTREGNLYTMFCSVVILQVANMLLSFRCHSLEPFV